MTTERTIRAEPDGKGGVQAVVTTVSTATATRVLSAEQVRKRIARLDETLANLAAEAGRTQAERDALAAKLAELRDPPPAKAEAVVEPDRELPHG